MQVITVPMMKLMISHIGVRHRRPLFFWGTMGIAKSEGINQAALENNGVVVDIRLSQYDSVDLRGFPGVNSDDKTTVWHVPSTMPFKGNPNFDEDGPLIFLFFDEANAAAPAVSAVMYQITNDRRCGEHILMDNVVVLLAGNKDTDNGIVNRQAAPLSNRLIHAELVPDIKAWTGWAASHPEIIPPELVAYLNYTPEDLHTYDRKNPEKAFATPRSWQYAAEFYRDKQMPDDVKAAGISGAVGEARAIKFEAFCKVFQSLPRIEDILADPEGIRIPEEMDVRYAMTVHVSGHMSKENVAPLQRFLHRMGRSAPELVVLAWTLAIQRDDSVCETDTFLNDYAQTYREQFQDD